jgi:hypothetical protein
MSPFPIRERAGFRRMKAEKTISRDAAIKDNRRGWLNSGERA